MTNKASNQQDDIWGVIAKGLVEAVKMVFSVFVTIVVAGSETTTPTNASTEDETLHTGYRHNDDKTVHFDNDA
ncbi:hypothetical protein [Yersinia ruckeri]|uniref:hypothetical protein n=1 Tax=Yersinia ruckeri TaxID=29486 RepID=UPI0005368C20|nr:hypothetical protein [Yersinia ruckeri]AUQ41237.1 hypothetical protein NJ56_04430 [Yersinia ruckeri]MCW6528017.1 hypothetical protein [Yersinia ruckeri]MCW6563189.1 hypothetical protein [Yersinia ruckeri]UZY05127.1 hypothetical protein LNQ41_001520 [Yersinia ruckeri]WMS06810.1 hypothetical protein RDY86_06755 [Yersinia ruckeri]